MSLIEVRGLKKSFGSLEVLKGVDLTVEQGERIAIIGGSGCGKSVFLRSLVLLEKPDAGQIFIDGQEITAKGAKVDRIRRSMGMVYQRFHLFSEMDVMDLEYTDSVARNVTWDTVEDLMTPEMRRAFLKAMYRYLVNWFDRQRAGGRFDSVFIMDIHNDDELYGQNRDDIYVIMECSEDTDKSGNHCLGEYWSKDEAFEVVDTLQNGVYGEDYGDILYERLEDTEYDQLMYLAVAPVFVEGELRYVVCLEYDWPAFTHILNVNLKSMALFGTDRILEALNRDPDATCAEALERVMEGIREFVDGAEQFDDITMMCFSYFGSAGPAGDGDRPASENRDTRDDE